MVGEVDGKEGEGGWSQGRWSDGKVSGALTAELAFFLPRSAAFHNFVKVTLTKSPKKRPGATKMLTVNLPSQRSLPRLTPGIPQGLPQLPRTWIISFHRTPMALSKSLVPPNSPGIPKTLQIVSQTFFQDTLSS